ncbi:cell wall-binding repeat-containing protein [Clostridium sp. OS1-26]|uniref:cell wall-binding repeat-containing protein n=1 Tax=Clostridium sp. OS1-26 TaxID=3070681 RepID=UPI0027E0DD70|nr:cell wall-binding repeat-containing protein [Clostridium sp. OS1-26]WML36740.1 cell wall-binding repeat-containing protein [Clostridium sp. OS1-26]
MNSRKYLKLISTLTLSLCITTAWSIQPIKAASEDTTVTTSAASDVSSLSKMGYDELIKAAKSMPEDSVIVRKILDTSTSTLKGQQFIPQDENIYYITNNIIDPNTVTYEDPITKLNTTFYKFLNVEPSRYPLVKYNSYCWEFKDGDLQYSGVTSENVIDEALYKQLTGGLPYIPSGSIIPDAGNTSEVNNKPSVNTLAHKRLNSMFDMAAELNNSPLDNVIITSGTSFADALSGTVLASKLKAPVFFMNTSEDSKVYDYVNTNLKKGGSVYILGKEGAINSDIENTFKKNGFIVIRLGGDNRYGTCSQINDKLNIAENTPVVIVNGENYPDALSISSIAAAKGYPILLTEQNSIPQETIDQLTKIKPSKIYVIGGSGVVSENVYSSLKGYSNDVSRIFGADRYETSMNICKAFSSSNNSTIVLATGTDFKNALTGSSVAAKYGAPIILVGNDASNVKSYIKNNNYKNVIILGDTNSISSGIEASVTN